jgi:hypothetical protein
MEKVRRKLATGEPIEALAPRGWRGSVSDGVLGREAPSTARALRRRGRSAHFDALVVRRRRCLADEDGVRYMERAHAIAVDADEPSRRSPPGARANIGG